MNDKIIKAKMQNLKSYSVKTVNDSELLSKKLDDQVSKTLDVFNKQAEQFAELIEQIRELKSNNTSSQEDKLNELLEALKAIEFKPVINVEKEQITIPEPVVKVITNDIYDEFKGSDTIEDETGSITYHGMLSRSGKWFIVRESGTKAISYRYASYKNNDLTYKQAIARPASLNYVFYNELEL